MVKIISIRFTSLFVRWVNLRPFGSLSITHMKDANVECKLGDETWVAWSTRRRDRNWGFAIFRHVPQIVKRSGLTLHCLRLKYKRPFFEVSFFVRRGCSDRYGMSLRRAIRSSNVNATVQPVSNKYNNAK